MKIVLALLLVLLAGGAMAQEEGVKTIEGWAQEGWKRLLSPDAPEGMPVTWVQAYWRLEASQMSPASAQDLKIQVQFRNNSSKAISTMHVALLLQQRGFVGQVLGLAWTAPAIEESIGDTLGL